MSLRDNACLQTDHRGTIKLILACVGETRRTHTEESIEDGYTRKREDGTTENRMESRMPTRRVKYWAKSAEGEETNRLT